MPANVSSNIQRKVEYLHKKLNDMASYVDFRGRPNSYVNANLGPLSLPSLNISKLTGFDRPIYQQRIAAQNNDKFLDYDFTSEAGISKFIGDRVAKSSNNHTMNLGLVVRVVPEKAEDAQITVDFFNYRSILNATIDDMDYPGKNVLLWVSSSEKMSEKIERKCKSVSIQKYNGWDDVYYAYKLSKHLKKQIKGQ
jgi:hypothetical protein